LASISRFSELVAPPLQPLRILAQFPLRRRFVAWGRGRRRHEGEGTAYSSVIGSYRRILVRI
jgi:hypothetical protein